jgi:hypothetical protein
MPITVINVEGTTLFPVLLPLGDKNDRHSVGHIILSHILDQLAKVTAEGEKVIKKGTTKVNTILRNRHSITYPHPQDHQRDALTTEEMNTEVTKVNVKKVKKTTVRVGITPSKLEINTAMAAMLYFANLAGAIFRQYG